MKFGLHILETPTGRFCFRGSVPVHLAYRAKNGDPLTADQVEMLAECSNPGMIAKTRTFESRADAQHAAMLEGYTVA